MLVPLALTFDGSGKSACECMLARPKEHQRDVSCLNFCRPVQCTASVTTRFDTLDGHILCYGHCQVILLRRSQNGRDSSAIRVSYRGRVANPRPVGPDAGCGYTTLNILCRTR